MFNLLIECKGSGPVAYGFDVSCMLRLNSLTVCWALFLMVMSSHTCVEQGMLRRV